MLTVSLCNALQIWIDEKKADAERKAAFKDSREVVIEDCGHMMHHDQPERLAAVIEQFLAQPRTLAISSRSAVDRAAGAASNT